MVLLRGSLRNRILYMVLYSGAHSGTEYCIWSYSGAQSGTEYCIGPTQGLTQVQDTVHCTVYIRVK